MLENEKVKIKIFPTNRYQYQKILNIELKNGDYIEIEQNKVLQTARTKVKCLCDLCGKTFLRMRKDVKKVTFCGNECRNKNLLVTNPNPPVDKIKVNCFNCKKGFEIFPSHYKLQEHFYCSRRCYFTSSPRETRPERLVRKWLEDNKIDFIQEKNLAMDYYVDFYLPKHNAILEVNGDYWHVNPDIFDVNGNDSNKKRLTDFQVDFLKSKREEIRIRRLREKGFKVFILWENDIYNNLSSLMNETFEHIRLLS